ncbi:hypothetical protein STEG23_008786, partial [Scotinomys teguina]
TSHTCGKQTIHARQNIHTVKVCDDYDRERNEYFFDRHSEAFGFILLYVRGHGKLRFAPRMCELSFTTR